MATVAPSADQASDLLQNLSLDSQAKSIEIPEPTKKTSVYQYGAVDSGISEGGQIPPFLQDLMDPSMLYHPYPSPYFYGGYAGADSTWDEYSRYNTDGVDMTSGVYADNGSVVYGGYGFAPYGPYSPAASPVPTMGNDGQLYGPQQYQYPPYFQPLTPTSGPVASTNQNLSTQTELSTSTATEQKPLPVETTKTNPAVPHSGNALKGNSGSVPYKPKFRNSSLNYNNTYNRNNQGGVPATGFQDTRYGFDGQYRNTGVNSFSKSSTPSRNQNFRQNNSNFMGLQHSSAMSGVGSAHNYLNRIYPSKYYGNYGDAFATGMGYSSNGYDSRLNSAGWLPVDTKYKNKGRGNGYYGYRNESDFGLNEMNRGPRGKGPKYPKTGAPVTIAVKGQTLPLNENNFQEKDELLVSPDRDQYNKSDFPEAYANAKFYVIKSYSEDDVHKSIKYKVWASTPTGNKKLDAAYQEAQQISGGCPVYLFFSVNASGQFVGLAEMLGPVDFDKNVDYWQQDKWTGCFPVKWHVVKDIPNSMLKHITLENNENKPVTNSRDTQEIKMDQGLKMIKIFKDHSSKTCILDDFEFYEIRQKCIQTKKAKQLQYRKQVVEVKNNLVKEDAVKDLQAAVLDCSKDCSQTAQVNNGDVKPLENGPAIKVEDVATKILKPAISDKKIVTNGVVNGC